MSGFRTEILAYEIESNRLRAAIYTAFKLRDRSRSHWETWSRACDRFHELLSPIDEWLRSCDTSDLASDPHIRLFIFEYLSADPYYFRSGYEKERLIRKIKKLDLTSPEKEIIRQLILSRIETRALREFRQICRMIPRIETKGFYEAVHIMFRSSDIDMQRRAKFALSYFSFQPNGEAEDLIQ